MTADSADELASVQPCDRSVTLRALAAYFLRLGAIGFGGPVALAGYMQRDLVEERGWVTPQEYRDGLAVAQVAPGPLAAQLAMWLAFLRFGVRGATVISLVFIAPALLLVIGLAWIYVAAGGAPWISSVFYGVAPAAIAIIALSAWRLTALTLGRDLLLVPIAVVVTVVTVVSGSEVAIVFVLAGVLVVFVRGIADGGLRRLGERFRGAFLALPLLGPAFSATEFQLPLLGQMFAFFTFAGALVFGSGLAIVPFLHQGLVVDNHWLTEQQFLDSWQSVLSRQAPS